MTSIAWRTGIVAWLCAVSVLPAHAQSGNPLYEPVISLCELCDELQKSVIEQQLATRDLSRAWSEARAHLSSAKANLTRARTELSGRQNASAGERQALQANVTALEAAVRAAEQAYDSLDSKWHSAIEEFARRSAQLELCNQRCPKPVSSRPPANTGPSGSPITTAGDAQTPGPAQCPECAKLLEELSRLRHLIWLWDDLLNGMRERRSTLRSERDSLMAKREALEEAQKTVDPAVRLSAAEYAQRVEQLNDEQPKVNAELERLDEDIEDARDRLRQFREERDELLPQLEECNRLCRPKKTQWFHKPLFWIPIGGAIGGVAVAAGDGTAPTAPVTVTQPQTAQVTTTTPAPPQQSSRRPSETLSVIGCVCADNSAGLDADMQLCQRLRQMRTLSNGNTMTLSGDAPLPVFQGTFSESSGEFELRSTATVGTSSTTAVIAGTVETNGNLHNLRVSFGGGGGRQTLYTLTTLPGQ